MFALPSPKQERLVINTMSNSGSNSADALRDGFEGATETSRYSSETFIEAVHKNFSSKLFLLGMIMLTAGHVLGVFFDLTLMNFLMRAFIVLPVVTGWLFYFGSRSPKPDGKFMLAIKLERFEAIIGFACSIGVIAIYVLIYLLSGLRPDQQRFVVVLAVPMAIVTFCFAAPSLIYMLYTRSMYEDIRSNIRGGSVRLLRGIGVFSVLGSLGIAFNLVDSFFGRGTIFMQDVRAVRIIVDRSVMRLIMDIDAAPWACLLFTLLSSAGLIIKIVTILRVRHAMTR